MKLSEKVFYLQGLMDGLEINDTTKEGKVLLKMAEILREVTLSMEDLEEEVNEIVELTDILDQDLGNLEEDIYEFDDEEDDDCCGDEDCGCGHEHYYEVICPTCGDTVCLDEGMIEEGSINCPNCDEMLEFDFDEEEGEDEEADGE